MPNEPKKPVNQDGYEIIKHEVVYEGVFRVVRYQLRYRLFDGNWSKVISREVVERQTAAALIPYDPVRDQVVLIEQFRQGALNSPQSPWLLEIVAGLVDRDEKTSDVAIREAKEEAGCEILDLYPICEYFTSPGGTNEYLSLFCGRIDTRDIAGIYGLAEEHENIRAFSVSREEAYIMLQEGKIKTSPAIMALQWLQLNHEWLRELWQIK